MCVQNFKCSGSWVINSALDSTQLDFDHEYLWNGAINRQAENGVMEYDFSTVGENKLVIFNPFTKNDLDF